VQYIVANTLCPLVTEAKERAQGQGGRAGALSLADEILAFKVLDPAMGSGHFLVDATEYLALQLAKDPYLQEEIPGDEDLLYWKRRVVERCIYGVDKNPLAVELAKLSLWLATVASEQPLSFLDHHLKHGDSLIGARVQQLGSAPPLLLTKKQLAQQQAGQSNLFAYRLAQHLPTVLGRILEITDVASDSYERVQLKETVNEAVENLKAPFERVANLWTSAYFGNKFTLAEYGEALDAMGTPEKLDAMPAVQRAQTIADERDFLHWELAFPEVFFDANGQSLGDRAGFDAVIGNPPYVNAIELNKSLSEFEKPYWRTRFESAEGAYDLYILFIEQSLAHLALHRLVGMITPNKFLAAPYATALREFLVNSHALLVIYDVSRLRVFEDASIYPVISIFEKGLDENRQYIKVEQAISPEHAKTITHPSELLTRLPDSIWGFLLSDGAELVGKIRNVSLLLAEVSEVVASTTAAESDAYTQLVMEDAKVGKRQAIRILNTGVIDRYVSLWGQTELTHQGKTFSRPMLVLDANIVPARRQDQYKATKLIFSKVALRIEAFPDIAGEFASMNTNFAIAPYALLGFFAAVCNSSLLSWVYGEYFGALRMGGGYFQFQAPQLSVLPIRRISFTTPAPERVRLLAQAIAAYERGATQNEMDAVLALIAQFLARDPEQSDVVHDLLAHLATQMMELNREKQARAKAFWDDLEGATDRATFKVLHEKGKQESSLYASSEAFQPFLRENSHATRRLDDALAWNEDAFRGFVKALAAKVKNLSELVAVFAKHNRRYGEITQRLRFTDTLIDRIVYQLYGLTPEEIRIVEMN
jgi:hypothetical protein